MAELELDHVTKRFGSTSVIEGIDLAVEDGELIVIVGPSGCGKSTLLRMVAGLEAASGGEIRIAGKRVNELEPMDRNIAMVFQNYALYPHMSVFDNMAYGLKIAKMDRTEIRRRVNEAADMLELAALLDRKPRQLSGGQRQRVAMGRAIVRDPVIFLFDEPLSNLDAKLRVLMRLEIKSLQRKLGTTSLYVTHDQIEAMTLADRMVVMNEGRAEQIGTPLDVYQRPASRFAAQFIGSPAMNIFPAELHDGSLGLLNGSTLKIDSRAKGSVMAGIRPEHMIPAAEGSLRMTVEMSEPVGANTLLHGRLKDSNQPMVASMQGVFVSPSGTFEQCFDIAPESVHLFDPETGKRLGT